jgi:hypothetical protein
MMAIFSFGPEYSCRTSLAKDSVDTLFSAMSHSLVVRNLRL